jgi:hypothetical protein
MCSTTRRRSAILLSDLGMRATIGSNGVAKGLYLTRDGQVLVEYGKRRVPISPAQYRANGYRPPCDKLLPEALPKVVAEAEFAGTTLTRAHNAVA